MEDDLNNYTQWHHGPLSASDQYAQLNFNSKDSIYNQPPPTPATTLTIGLALCLIGFLLWIRRVMAIGKDLDHVLPAKSYTCSLRLRCWLTAYTENDSALFTCVRVAGQSIIVLAGLQLNYRLAFLVMLAFFALEACADSLRIYLALHEAKSFQDLVVTSKFLRADLRKHPLTTSLVPTNVYEDLTRDPFVVGMIFVTQVLLIVFVVVDGLETETHYCLDGTPNCPVTGTLGSWAFYLLGIFMACVFHLGPKTNFGRQSEQNPAFWLKLFMSTKQAATKNPNNPNPPTYSWYDPVEDARKSLQVQGISHWIRYIMSFLINGVGFLILVHALPIQVAAQSSLTGVVFRAVGMIYLVNLDDTTGYEMTMIANDATATDEDASVLSMASVYSLFGGRRDDDQDKDKDDNELDIVRAAEKIIVKAQAKLDALKYKKKKRRTSSGRKKRGSKTANNNALQAALVSSSRDNDVELASSVTSAEF